MNVLKIIFLFGEQIFHVIFHALIIRHMHVLILISVVNNCMSASDDSLATYKSKWADLFQRTKALREVSSSFHPHLTKIFTPVSPKPQCHPHPERISHQDVVTNINGHGHSSPTSI